MIDWVTAIIPCRHPDTIYGGRFASISADGEIEWVKEKQLQVEGSYSANFSVKSNGPDMLYISGNPAKWLQGHNLFGSDDLIALVWEVMHRLIPILGLTPTVQDLDAWKAGRYELKRVDCTAMYELPTRADVRAWLRAAEFQSKSRHGRPTMRGGTLYFGQHSRRWSIKFYSKGDELEAKGKGHSLPYELPDRDRLIEWADNKLRAELTLRGIQLKELGLDTASNWTRAMPLGVLQTYIETLNMADQFSLTPQILDDLPGRLVAVYKLWMDGEDLRGMFPKATYYRYRSELLQHGIDIAIRQSATTDNVIPLVRALRPEAIAPAPQWAIGTREFFDTKGRSI